MSETGLRGEFGMVTEPGTVRMERLLPGPVERVWAYLTEPDKRALWLAGGPMLLEVGGAVELHFDHARLSHEPTPEQYRSKRADGIHLHHGRVTGCEPPRVLAYTWDEGAERRESEVCFELSPAGAGTRLVLTHRRLAGAKQMISVASGWDTHLDLMEDRLAGREPIGFWTAYFAFEKEYQRRVGG